MAPTALSRIGRPPLADAGQIAATGLEPAVMPPAAPSHRVLIVTDAWRPQVNGVVRTLTAVTAELRAMGHNVEVIGPDRFRTIPCPTYPDISLSLLPRRRLIRIIEEFQPDALHIATEGPLGFAARSWARRKRFPFTTAVHTRFAEYVHARIRLPPRFIYAWMRRFHRAGAGTMVATQSLRDELTGLGFANVLV
jgi:glycosyltransferase involved in cell wall biosynthesis